MPRAIRAEGLVKNFGKTKALAGTDLAAEAGTVLGVLGPNGAGKTTAVRILTTLLQADAGRAEVGGYDVVRDGPRPADRRPRRDSRGRVDALGAGILVVFAPLAVRVYRRKT